LTGRPIPAQTKTMARENIPSLIVQIIDELRVHGILITNRGGEWCVNRRGGTRATEFITDDLQQAFEHGRALARRGRRFQRRSQHRKLDGNGTGR
jgi:hypothetical protein